MQQQRLLKNMGAHTVVLDLLQIPYENVSEQSLNHETSSVFDGFHIHALTNEFRKGFRKGYNHSRFGDYHFGILMLSNSCCSIFRWMKRWVRS